MSALKSWNGSARTSWSLPPSHPQDHSPPRERSETLQCASIEEVEGQQVRASSSCGRRWVVNDEEWLSA
jgi:hypothetical protein